MYLKRMLRTCRIQIQDEKVCFFEEEPFFRKFLIFFQRGDPLVSERKFLFFSIFQNFQKKFLKMASMGPKEC